MEKESERLLLISLYNRHRTKFVWLVDTIDIGLLSPMFLGKGNHNYKIIILFIKFATKVIMPSMTGCLVYF